MSNKPDFNACVVTKSGDKDIWTKIGAAWKHKNCITIQLNSAPVNGKLILVEPKKNDSSTDQSPDQA